MDSDEASPDVDGLLRLWYELRDLGRTADARALCDRHPALVARLAIVHEPGLDGEGDPLAQTMSIVRGDGLPDEEFPSRRMTSGGAFRDLRFHAEGGLGEVYEAKQAELNRIVALKFLKLKRADDAESQRRFLLEAEVTGRLEHPGVVPVYGMGRDEDGNPCYAMRFIRGQTLQEALDAFHGADHVGREPSERSLALRALLRRFLSVCNTIAYAHSRGILHRDLKPKNIMLGRYDETLVVDWGLAKPFDTGDSQSVSGEERLAPGSGSDSETPTTVGAIGTPSYMSPEQAEGKTQGPASDIFGLGATLYAILAGQPPLRGVNLREIANRIRKRDFPKPREIKPSVPAALEAICLKAMSPEPGDRYRSALDLASEIERWLADEPVLAWTEPPLLRASRWLRRHRTVLLACVALFASAFVGLIVIDVVIGRERTAAVTSERRALASEKKALENLGVARKTVNEILVHFADHRLAHIPQMELQRRDLAAKAVQFNEAFLAEAGSDPEVRREAAMAFRRTANIYRFIGQFDQARGLHRRSVALYEGLVAESPSNRKDLRLMADAMTDQAVALRISGRGADALSTFRQSVQICETLPAVRTLSAKGPRRARSAVDMDEVQALGRALQDLANLQFEMGDVADSRKASSRSAELLSSIVDGQSPPPLPAGRILLLALLIRGEAEGESGLSKSALSTFSRALNLDAELAKLAPSDTDFRHLRARVLSARGKVLSSENGRLAEASKAYEEAASIEEGLVAEYPESVSYKLGRAVALAGKCRTLSRDSKDTAEQAGRAALAGLDGLTQRSGKVPGVHEYRGLVLIDLARLADARGESADARALRTQAQEEVRLSLLANPRGPLATEASRRLREP